MCTAPFPHSFAFMLKITEVKLISQSQENFKRGSAELMALHLLQDEDMYGYQLTQIMEEKSEGKYTILEGTLYLILYRLVDAGYLTTYTKLVGKKRTRRYYHLEDSGREYLETIMKEYIDIKTGVDLVLDRYKETNIIPIKKAESVSSD